MGQLNKEGKIIYMIIMSLQKREIVSFKNSHKHTTDNNSNENKEHADLIR